MLAAQAEQRLRRLRAQLRIHAGEVIHARAQHDAGKLRLADRRELLRPWEVIRRERAALVRALARGDAVHILRELHVLPELRLPQHEIVQPSRLRRAEHRRDITQHRDVLRLCLLELRFADRIDQRLGPLPRQGADVPKQIRGPLGGDVQRLQRAVGVLLFICEHVGAQHLHRALLRAALRLREIRVEQRQRPVGGVRE